MSYPYDHPLLGRIDAGDAANLDASENSAPHEEMAELEHLIARFDRIAADQMRNRRYQRRTNVGTSGFRRNQRRAVTA